MVSQALHMSAPISNALELHSGIVLKGHLSMVKDVRLTGKFEGELQTLGCLTVASGGAITGSIDAGALVLEPGNLVEARVKIAPPPKSSLKAPVENQKETTSFWSGRFQKLKEFAFGRR
jgi:hypothetical protein